MSQSAQEILMKACQYDAAGRRLEALSLYEDGIRILLNNSKSETDLIRKKHFQVKIKEYIERAEQIKVLIEKRSSKGEVIDRIHISEGATGHSYKSLFGKYLDYDVKEVEIEEPYIREHYQFVNLIILLELIVKKCKNIKYITLTTTADPKHSSDQQKSLHDLRENLTSKGISFVIKISDNLHDRQIILSNGFTVKIGRGLHFFKATNPKYSLGINDYDFRECMETDVLIIT